MGHGCVCVHECVCFMYMCVVCVQMRVVKLWYQFWSMANSEIGLECPMSCSFATLHLHVLPIISTGL